MKKQLLSICLSALASMLSLSAQTSLPAGIKTAGDAWSQFRQVAGQSYGTLRTPGYGPDRDRDNHDCDRCKKGGKGKKSRKHDGCSQPGNHYGKHKNKNRGNDDSCCCCDRHHHGRSDRDGYGGRREDDKWYGQGRHDRDDDGYRSDRRSRDTQTRREPEAGQRRPSSEKVKSRRSPGSRPTPSTSGAKRKAPGRPGSER